MKKAILFLILVLSFSLSAFGQTDCESGQIKCVLVPQEFVDAAAMAFKEGIAKDKVIAAQKEVIAAKTELLQEKDKMLALQQKLIEQKDERIEKLVKVTCTKRQFFIFLYREKRCL